MFLERPVFAFIHILEFAWILAGDSKMYCSFGFFFLFEVTGKWCDIVVIL